MEYAGYVSPEKSVDWQALSNQMAEKIYGIGTKREAEKEALDKKAKDLENIVNDPSIMGKSQTANQMFLDGAFNAKDQIWKWNKDLKAGIITPKEYSNNITNLQDNWSILASSAKTFDERYQEVLKRQEEGVASNLELEFLDKFGQMANIPNTKIQVSQDGRVYMAKVDPNTGKVIGDVMDTRTMNMPENIQVNKVDVGSTVGSLTEGWDPYTTFKDLGRGGELNIEDIRDNPAYKEMKAKVAESVASNSNPRAQVSVLVDNGVLTDAMYYYDDNDYKAKKQELIDDAIQIKKTAGQKEELSDDEMKKLELNLIRLQKEPNGVINPVLTEEQQKLAKDRVMNDVEIRMERKVSGSPKQQWSSSTGGGGGDDKDSNAAIMAGYRASLEAFGIDTESVKSGNIQYTGQSNFNGLSRSYQYRKAKDGSVEVYAAGTTFTEDGEAVDRYGNPTEPRAVARKPKDLAQFIYGGQDVAKSQMKYEKARTMYLSGTTPKSEVPSYNREDLLANGWTEAQIAQAVKEGKIKVN